MKLLNVIIIALLLNISAMHGMQDPNFCPAEDNRVLAALRISGVYMGYVCMLDGVRNMRGPEHSFERRLYGGMQVYAGAIGLALSIASPKPK